MSATGTKQTCRSCRSMSAFGGKADIGCYTAPIISAAIDRDIGRIGIPHRSSLLTYEVCYPFCRKHGRYRAVKRRALISLLIGGTASDWTLSAN
jgi:hypothetical protein